jgi:hypothetical protein
MSHDPAIIGFMGGALATGFLAVALFFLRFWRSTHDVLFAVFSVAFTLLALNHALPVLVGVLSENRSGIYLLRLLAFLLIIGAILHKNLRRS